MTRTSLVARELEQRGSGPGTGGTRPGCRTRARSRAPAGAGRPGSWTRRCCASARPRGPCSARPASPRAAPPGSASAGAAGRAGRRRAAPATPRHPARPASARASVCGTFVVRKISSRGTPLSAIPRPTSRSFSYARAVSICRYPISSASRTPSVASCPVTSHVPYPMAGTRTPRTSIVLSPLLMERVAIPLLRLATSRAISSAGRAPPRQGGGHWFEPSIAHQKVCICGPFVVVVRDQFDPPLIRGSRLVRPPWLAWHARGIYSEAQRSTAAPEGGGLRPPPSWSASAHLERALGAGAVEGPVGHGARPGGHDHAGARARPR